MKKKESTPTAWNKKKSRLKKQFSNLTDEDLIYEKGNEEQLISHLQKKLGKSRAKVKSIIKNL